MQQKSEGNEQAYNRSKKKAMKVATKAMMEEAEKELNALKSRGEDFFKKLKMMKRDLHDIGDKKCIKDKIGMIYFDEAERGYVVHGRLMNQENE